MRAECLRTIEEAALADARVVVVASDPGAGFMPELAKKYPERLMIEGVCEQGLVGMAAGMAAEGFYPYIVMIAAFGTRRCYEQLLLDFGLHGFSGCLVGIGGGFHYSVLGPTHVAVDDLMLTLAIPGSVVFAPAEPDEAITLTRCARDLRGLSYLRVSATTEALSNSGGQIIVGKGRVLDAPASVLFISCGSATLAAKKAAGALAQSGIAAGVLHLHTLKPLDVQTIRSCAEKANVVLCVEEHRRFGGLSGLVLQALADAGKPVTLPRFVSVGVGDDFPSGYGSYDDMARHYEMTGDALAERARALLSS